MNRQTLNALKDLRNELQNRSSLSVDDRKLLEQLVRDVEELLAVSGEAGALGDHPTHVRLQEAMQRFEVSHPELTAMMARIVDSLSNMGI